MTPEDRKTVIEALQFAEDVIDADMWDLTYIYEALAIMRRESACKYPDCVDNGPDGKCAAWLTGDCEGPKHG